MKIKKWIKTGRIVQEYEDTTSLLEFAYRALEKAEVHQIVGETLFVGEDGKTYTGTVEFVISEVNHV